MRVIPILNLLLAATQPMAATARTLPPRVLAASVGVRTSAVIGHLHSIGHEINWHMIDNNTKIAHFALEDWEQWSTALIGHERRSAEVVVALQPRKDDKIFCYVSGSWARDYVLSTAVNGACGAMGFGVAQGSVQIVERTGLRNVAGDPMNVYFRFAKFSAAFVSSVACSGTLNHPIYSECQGKGSDTRGGTSSNANAEFDVDPQTLNCNC